MASNIYRGRLCSHGLTGVSALALAAVAASCSADGTGGGGEALTRTKKQAYFAPPPDASDYGPNIWTSAEYKLPAVVDPDIIGDRATELWARMYRPSSVTPGEKYPLVVFLHGNHGTCGNTSYPRTDGGCQYTYSGTCGGTFPVVTPNHLGYGYVAGRLASWGYFVVSINANRGITCGGGVAGDAGLNLARGRLVLKHLQKLSQWNNGLEETPDSLGLDLSDGYLDFGSVGLMGHSRGGEGVRAAYNLYRDPGSPWPARIPDPLTIQGIFEIGPVDGQTSRTLNSNGTNWVVLLPMCDGDVSDLQGIKPFDRALKLFDFPATPKGTFTVFGTNHNYYNTEWQRSDSSGCSGTHTPIFDPALAGSPGQQTIGAAAMGAFFRGFVGGSADPAYASLFDPAYALTSTVALTTRVDRGYIESPHPWTSFVLDDIPGGAPPKSSSGLAYTTGGLGSGSFTVGGVPEHDGSQTAALIRWFYFPIFGTPPRPFWQSNWSPRNLRNYETLDIRLERAKDVLNPATLTAFSIALVKTDGSLTGSTQAQYFTRLNGPVAGPYSNYHTMLQTARIPLSQFDGIDFATESVAGVRLTFDSNASGAIYVANIRADGASGSFPLPFSAERLVSVTPASEPVDTVYADGNVISGARLLSRADGGQDMELTLSSPTPFEPHDELIVLDIGGKEVDVSRFAETGDLHTVSFVVPRDELAKMQAGVAVNVKYGHGASRVRWDFGTIDPARLAR